MRLYQTLGTMRHALLAIAIYVKRQINLQFAKLVHQAMTESIASIASIARRVPTDKKLRSPAIIPNSMENFFMLKKVVDSSSKQLMQFFAMGVSKLNGQ